MTTETTETETIALSDIVFFPTDIRHPETGEWVRVVDYKRQFEYASGVLAYVDPDTGEYGGLLSARDGIRDEDIEVECRSQTDE